MADKRISDFPTLADAQDDDLILVSSAEDTYNMKVATLKKATAQVAADAVQAAESAVAQVQAVQDKAAAAQSAAENAGDEAAAALEQVGALNGHLAGIVEGMAAKVDGAYEENGYLYLTSGDEVVAGPLGPFSGSGGGSGTSSGYLVSLKNLLPSRTLTVSGESAALLRFAYTSADEDGEDDGPGVGTVTVGGARKATFSISQGENELDVSPYLTAGANTVKIRVENSEGASRTLSYTVTVVTLSMATTFAPLGTYTGAVVFSYTVTGSGAKTVHFLMDGTEIGSEVVQSSGRSRSFALPAQADGAHKLTAFAEVTESGVSVKSNTLQIGMLWISPAMSAPAVLSNFSQTEAKQGEILTIPYIAYDPQAESAAVTLDILDAGGTVCRTQSLTVDRTPQAWAVQDYPAGAVTLRISCGSASFSQVVQVSESTETIEPITDALALCFDPAGRSNNEDSPAQWTDGNITASFSGVGFSGADGWLTDGDGAAIFRLLPGGKLTIPYKIFETDARSAGLTVELEMATHNVRDYDTVVLSCLSGGRGLQVASQYAALSSEQSRLSMQFKEDEKVRVSFVVEPRNLHRLISVYVDGVLCGAMQYPENDDFSQNPAQSISVGAVSSGIDIYKLRVYAKGLARQEILDNFIADRSLLSQRLDLARQNDIFDLAEDITISKLPPTLPYMVVSCPQLPQYKGDKKACSIEYVNPADIARSFTAEGAHINVQGTSSAGYKKKNFKFSFKDGKTYKLREDSLPASVFCMKADVASSEGANNVELVRLYNDTVPHQTPPQETDPKVRVGIDGVPCILFWHNTDTGETRFWGKYNFNFDKGAENVFGLTEGCESWEFKNNTSPRVLFQSADFTGTSWRDDFEARYPEGSLDCRNLAALCAWVASTDRGAVGTEEEKAARLQKFKTEFEEHFVKAPMLFYYLFTEVFLMVDSRAKNFFPTTFDGTHWLPFPYDFDTALGINNEGQLVFDYDLEDTDHLDGANIFNGQESVLWCNVRDAFGDEIRIMYNSLRSGGQFDFDTLAKRFEAHQDVWPQAVWNEDAWEKYLEPLEHDNDGSYLAMLQGPKASQRAWWLYNGFRYRDSKYRCGDAQGDFITLRCYQAGDITVTPYSHVWPRVQYGSYTVTRRGKRNLPCTLACPLEDMNDTEVYIYSADRLAAIGDLSPLQVGYANFSMAGKLQSLKLGDGGADYQNTRLTELYVGNNGLLSLLDIQNCVNLSMSVDLSGCVGLEQIKARGSSITGVSLPAGGRLRALELPDTVTNLTLRDLKHFETLDMAGYGNLTTLRIENTPNVPLDAIITGAANLNRVRLLGVEWQAQSEASLQESITKLKSCIGLDAAGQNTPSAIVTGRVLVASISPELLTEINDSFPQLVVVADGEPQFIVRYVDWDNTLLYRAVVGAGSAAPNPVTSGLLDAPTREGTEETRYAFRDFGALPQAVSKNESVVAQYDTQYRVRFMNGESVFNTQWVTAGANASTPSGTPAKASTAQYSYTFSGWQGNYTNVTGPVDIEAKFTSTVRKYTVTFYNGSTLLQTVQNVPYGGSAKYTGDTPASPDGPADDYPFEGWNPQPTNITGTTKCMAVFGSPLEIKEIEDSWDNILAACADGSYKQKYKIGNYKPLDMGTEGIINMQIAGRDVDALADGSGMAPLSWVGIELLKTGKRMNPNLVTNYDYPQMPSWAAGTGSNANLWTTQINYCKDSVARATWTITAEEAGTVEIDYSTSSGVINYNKLTVEVNGEKIAKDYHSSTYAKHTIDVQAEDTVTVSAAYTLLAETNSCGRIRIAGTGSITITADIEEGTKRVFRDYQLGTGSIGGWEKSELRKYYQGTLKPLIPGNVKAGVKTVLKSHTAYDTAGKSFTQTTEDDLWTPSHNEMFGSSGSTNQPRYKALFPDNESRKKSEIGAASAKGWRLRSGYNKGDFYMVDREGKGTFNGVAYVGGGVSLCFCT